MKQISLSRARRIEFLTAIAVTSLLVVMHLVLLANRGPLWRDEISSLSAATAPTLKQFWASLGLDPMPALFLLLLRYWQMLVGDSDFALRILGCVIGLACIGAFWMNARLLGRRTPLISLVLLGICPTLVIWGDSLRGYGLAVCLIVIAFALFWRLIEQPTGWAFAGATGAAILSVQSVYVNSMLIFACGVGAAIVAARRRQWTRAALPLASGALAALSLLPYVSLFNTTAGWASLSQINFSLANSCKMLAIALLGPGNYLMWAWLLVILAAAVLALLSQCSRGVPSSRRDLTLYALLASVGGLVCTMTFFRMAGWGTNVWYYLPMLAVAAAAIDLIFDLGALLRLGPMLRIGLALVSLSFFLPLSLRAVDVRATDVDLVAAVISKQAAPEDLVIVWPVPDGITFQRYLRRPLNWVTIPPALHLPGRPGDDLLAAYRDPNGIQSVLDRVEVALKGNHRVWLASSWPLQLPEGAVHPVLPLSESNPRKMGYFLRGWGYLVAQEVQMHVREIATVEVPNEQPVSVYEHSSILLFSGWKDSAVALP